MVYRPIQEKVHLTTGNVGASRLGDYFFPPSLSVTVNSVAARSVIYEWLSNFCDDRIKVTCDCLEPFGHVAKRIFSVLSKVMVYSSLKLFKKVIRHNVVAVVLVDVVHQPI